MHVRSWMTNEKITIPGVREELRCPECGRYDSDIVDSTKQERDAIYNFAFPSNGDPYKHKETYCDCYDRKTSDGTCPHCGVEIENLWEYELSAYGSDIDCPHCDKPIFAEPVTQIKLTALRPKAKV